MLPDPPARPLGRTAVAYGVVALFVLTAAAGCITGTSKPGGLGRAGTGVATSGTAPSPGTGAISGTVLTPEGAWLSGAHIVIVGGTAKDTDSKGRFAFNGLGPGRYLLHISADAYLPVEEHVDVADGQVAEREFVLIPIEDADAGYRPHFHDLWGDLTEMPLFDGTVEWPRSAAEGGTGLGGCYNTVGGVTQDGDAGPTVTTPGQSGQSGTCWIDFYLGDLPDPQEDHREDTVLPGTKEVEVSVTWRETDHVDAIRFSYRPANQTNAFTKAFDLVPGEPQRFPVRPPMNDHGHQTYSLWAFRIDFDFVVAGKEVVALKQSVLVRNLVGDFAVQMTMHKGIVEPEPPHPRFWQAGPRIALAEGEWWNLTGLTTSRDPTARSMGAGFVLNDNTIVPPGTSRLDVELEYWSETPVETVKDLDEVFSEKTLVFRTASINPRVATWADFRKDDPIVTPAAAGAHARATWALDLSSADETDAFYQSASLWFFSLANRGEEDDGTLRGECPEASASPQTSAGCGGIHFRLTVVAENGDWDRDFGPRDA